VERRLVFTIDVVVWKAASCSVEFKNEPIQLSLREVHYLAVF